MSFWSDGNVMLKMLEYPEYGKNTVDMFWLEVNLFNILAERDKSEA